MIQQLTLRAERERAMGLLSLCKQREEALSADLVTVQIDRRTTVIRRRVGSSSPEGAQVSQALSDARKEVAVKTKPKVKGSGRATPTDKVKYIGMYNEGKSIGEIATLCGVPYNKVHYYIYRYITSKPKRQ